MEKLETYLGTLAVEKGFISQECLAACIQRMDEESYDKPIDNFLMERKLINEEQLQNLQMKRKINLRKLEEQALLEYLQKMKLVDSNLLMRFTAIQRNASQQKTYVPISMLLVSHGSLTQDEIDKMLQLREVQRYVLEAIGRDDLRRTSMIGRVLGGYEIQSKIAAGGMGVVYKALQLELNRIVALKIIFEKFASTPRHLKQFFREAKLSADLNHPNLVHIFEMGDEQGFFYYSMELVEGTNFGDYIKEYEGNKLPQEEAMDYMLQAGRGLEHIHNHDIIHNDIKPANFIIRSDKILKIMDLGLARQSYIPQKKRATMGTPFYMAPELIYKPEEADHRADIYAMGVSYYKMLTGEHPITGDNAKEIIENITRQRPKPIQFYTPEINPEINRVVLKMIEKDVKERYQSMTDVINDLDRILFID
ncbi:MAG: serine/threonine protein kinase [Planctomycetes bacterium]|jgi:serine/threonine-protein kinase|nr:serine/threonine protein kinase [Planctomycetota bacterium]HPY74226.1 serine/threonine-protein kinase [Planctomycetota bacterium]HQB00055.1 serine/threonine-protein kinase [Planctomycetota bacterium]HRU51269.1 serine/threonine-protein kinase [Planctomycetota bacterium]